MSMVTYAFVIIFWMPIILVIGFNLLWDLKPWQNADYTVRRIWSHLRWDYSLTHRTVWQVIAKSAAAAGLIVFLVDRTSVIPLIALVFLYVFWVDNAFSTLRQIANNRYPRLHWDFRLALIVMLAAWLLSVSIWLIADGLLGLGILPGTTNIPDLIGQLLPHNTEFDLIMIPSAYAFLLVSALSGVFLDLGSGLFSLALVVLSYPIDLFYQKLIVLKARNKLSMLEELLVVSITGSYGKTTTKAILKGLLQEDFNVVTTPVVETNIADLARTIIQDVQDDTQILIIDMNSYELGAIQQMCRLAPPHVAILTGISTDHAALFGSLESTLAAKAELIDSLEIGGTAIYNGDDEYVLQIAGARDGKEILYAVHSDPHKVLKDNQLEVDYYHLDELRTNKHENLTEFILLNQSQRIELKLPWGAKQLLHSILAATAAAIELGITMDKVRRRLPEAIAGVRNIEIIAGDNSTTLLYDPAKTSLTAITNDLEMMAHLPGKHKFMLTGGIKELGKYKHDVYPELAKLIHQTVDVLITYDQDLAHAAKQNNTSTEVIAVKSVDELLTAVRQRLSPQDLILINSDIDTTVLAALRSDR